MFPELQISADIFAAIYLVATVFFILGLKGLSSPKTALNGNRNAMIGMTIAIVATLLQPEVRETTWIWAGLAVGAVIGIAVALKIDMKAMPQLVAALHSFVGLAAVFIAAGTYYAEHASGEPLSGATLFELGVGSLIGAITFTGSLVAFAKLQELVSSNPLVFKGQHLLNAVLGLVMFGFTAQFVMTAEALPFWVLTSIALVLGFLLVLPIGGADMPVVVSMLNSYSGWAAAATGFTLENPLLITTGALVGSSGAILSYIMCKA
ncbi:MAG: NAD(P)(+) transhydrogenase (Re/Si-specific) subunit beta, partial [Oligoflexia bacterium]